MTKPTPKIEQEPTKRPIARPKTGLPAKEAITPEMRELAQALTNPEGDPYTNARKLGFYCEQCG